MTFKKATSALTALLVMAGTGAGLVMGTEVGKASTPATAASCSDTTVSDQEFFSARENPENGFIVTEPVTTPESFDKEFFSARENPENGFIVTDCDYTTTATAAITTATTTTAAVVATPHEDFDKMFFEARQEPGAGFVIDDIGPAIAQYHVKPGDIKNFGNYCLEFKDFQFVSEEVVSGHFKLSGSTLWGGDWKCSITGSELISPKDNLPFTVTYGTAVGTAICTVQGPEDISGFYFNTEETLTATHAGTVEYVSGNGWEAMIMDSQRYSEWKYSETSGKRFFPNRDDYRFVATTGAKWLIATKNAPEIYANTDDTEADAAFGRMIRKLETVTPDYEVTDIKWGNNYWNDANATITDGSYALHGKNFDLEIFANNPLGWSAEAEWTAALVPASAIPAANDAIIHYDDFKISSSADNEAFLVEIPEKKFGRSEKHQALKDASNDYTIVVTVSDGKHADVVTVDADLWFAIMRLA